MEKGCSFGGLKYHGEKGRLRNYLGVQKAVFIPIVFHPSF
jgi:hypothetical protein